MRSSKSPFAISLLGLTLLALPTTLARAQDNSTARVALFQSSTDDPALHDLAAALDPVLAAELDRSDRVQIAERPALDLPAMQLALDCVGQTAECLRTITDQAHVEGLIAASLRRAGSETVITILYFDARGVGAMKGATRKHSGDNVEQDTLDDVPAMLDELLPKPAAPASTLAPQSTQLTVATPQASAIQPQNAKLPLGPIVLGAGGAVLVGVGVAFGLSANANEDAYAKIVPHSSKDVKTLQSKLDTGKSHALLSNVGIGVGAAAITGSVVWYLLSNDGKPDSSKSTSAKLSPLLSPHQLGLSLHGRM